jgi:hypothetical protein
VQSTLWGMIPALESQETEPWAKNGEQITGR